LTPSGPRGAAHASTQLTHSYCRPNLGDCGDRLPPVNPGDGQSQRLAARERGFDGLLVESTGTRSRHPPRRLIWADGRLSLSRSFLLRRRTDRRQMTKRLDTMVRRVASVFRIDLMDLSAPMHSERPLGPREPRVTAAAGRRDRGEHTRDRESLLITHSGPMSQANPKVRAVT
jgi:hypothetical protein